MSPVDQIWGGWRARYIVGGEGRRPNDDSPGSVFTRLLTSGLPDEDTHIVHRGEHSFAVMNAYPYTVGHLLVLPYTELADVEDLDAVTTADLWATVTDAVRAVRAAVRPVGVNIGVNMGRAAGGSVPEHLHVHVVPRWPGDTNFMASIAGATTLPEALPVTAAKIRAAWPESPAR